MDEGFTIHFATINTRICDVIDEKITIFTIHFATINTQKTLLYFHALL